MARISYVESLLAGLENEQRRVLKLAFEYVLDNLRWGRPEDGARAENAQQYYFEATTAAVANAEFTIAHGLAAAPYALQQVLPLDAEGAQLVPLRVTRAADESRIYLSSPTTNAPIRVKVEV